MYPGNGRAEDLARPMAAGQGEKQNVRAVDDTISPDRSLDGNGWKWFFFFLEAAKSFEGLLRGKKQK